MYLEKFFADIYAITGFGKFLNKKPFIFHFVATTFKEIEFSTISIFIFTLNINDKRNTLLYFRTNVID